MAVAMKMPGAVALLCALLAAPAPVGSARLRRAGAGQPGAAEAEAEAQERAVRGLLEGGRGRSRSAGARGWEAAARSPAAPAEAEEGASGDDIGEGIEEPAEAEEGASGDDIGEGIEELERTVVGMLSGRGRRQDINTTAEFVNMIFGLVRRFEDIITRRISSARQALQHAADRFASCPSPTAVAAAAAGFQATWAAEAAEHRACRTEEANLYVATVDCNARLSVLIETTEPICREWQNVQAESLSADVCASHTGEVYTTWVSRLRDTFQAAWAEVQRKKWNCENHTEWVRGNRSECEGRMATHQAKQGECNTTASEMDEAACSAATTLQRGCTGYHTCHGAALGELNQLANTTRPEEARSKREWTTLARIECLLGPINGTTGHTIEECMGMAVITTHLNVVYPVPPAKEQCELPTLYPCSSAYVQQEYQLPSGAQGTCTPCAGMSPGPTAGPMTSTAAPSTAAPSTTRSGACEAPFGAAVSFAADCQLDASLWRSSGSSPMVQMDVSGLTQVHGKYVNFQRSTAPRGRTVPFNLSPSAHPELSIELWFRATGYGQEGWIVCSDDSDGTTPGRGITLWEQRPGGIFVSGVPQRLQRSSFSYPVVGAWYFMVVTFKALPGQSTIHLTRAHAWRETQIFEDRASSSLPTFNVGGCQTGSPRSVTWPPSPENGVDVAVLRVWTRLLQPGELDELYQIGLRAGFMD